MKTHTSDFKEEIKLLGKQQSVRITYTLNNEQIILTDEDINSATPNYEASLLKSVMKVLELDSNVSIPKGTEIKFEYGLLVNGAYEYLDYGNYIVAKEPEKQEDTLSYKITCYDKMLYSMKDYEHIDITYPTTIYNFLKKLCEKIGLTMKEANFANMTRTVPSDLFMTINEDGTYSSMGYTYRDVLDQIAEVTGGCICLTLDDKVEVRYVNKTINYEQSEKSNIIQFKTEVEEPIILERLEGKSIQATRSGKNLLNLLKCSFSRCTLNSDNKSLTCSINNYYYASVKTTELNNWLLQNKGKKITFSTGTTLEGKNTGIVIFGTRSNGSTYQEANETGTGKCSITIADDFTAITSIELRFNRQNTPFTDTTTVINYAMLELGAVATEYEQYGASPSPDYPSEIENIEGNIEFKVANGLEETDENYQEQVVTFPLGEEKLMKDDYLADDGIHHKRKQIVLDGSDDEGWAINQELDEYISFYLGVEPYKLITPDKFCYCSHFETMYVWSVVSSLNAEYLWNHSKASMGIKIKKSRLTSINVVGFKAWLSENPIKIEYKLAEEEIVPYTEAQKTILTSIKTMKGTNIFEFPSDTIISYPINYDTIDEEYINDTNVNFGEKYRTNQFNCACKSWRK